jgi:hypothetical protein
MSATKEHYHDVIEKAQRESGEMKSLVGAITELSESKTMEQEKPDKRYLAFGFDDYDPNGGLSDMRESFDTIGEAIAYLKSISYDNKDLYDRISGRSIDLSLYGIE